MQFRNFLKHGLNFKEGFVDSYYPVSHSLLSIKKQTKVFLSSLLCITAETQAIGLVAYNQSFQLTRLLCAAEFKALGADVSERTGS